MSAFRIGLFTSIIAAAALIGCSEKKDAPVVETTPSSVEKSEDIIVRPKATVTDVSNDDGRSKIEIVLPGHEGKGKTFRGELGIYDETTFENGPGIDPSSREMLYVVSLDKSAETLIAVHYADGDSETAKTGFAYVFKRKDASSPYVLSWMAPDLTSKTATDVDTYLLENKVSLGEAVTAVKKRAVIEKRVDVAEI